MIYFYTDLVNNAGDIEVNLDVRMYQESRYNFNTGGATADNMLIKELLILSDCMYLLGIVYMFYQFIKTCIHIVVDLWNYKTLSIEWNHIQDMIILILSLTNLYYWIKLYIVDDRPKLPIDNNDDFQKLVDVTSDTKKLHNVSAVLVVFLFLRNLRLLTTLFPSFGALFDTIKVARYDLVNIFIIIAAVMLGFIYFSLITLGPYIPEFDSFFSVLNIFFFTLVGQEEPDTFKSSLILSSISNFIFIVSMIILNFIILKLTVSIVIIR